MAVPCGDWGSSLQTPGPCGVRLGSLQSVTPQDPNGTCCHRSLPPVCVCVWGGHKAWGGTVWWQHVALGRDRPVAQSGGSDPPQCVTPAQSRVAAALTRGKDWHQ